VHHLGRLSDEELVHWYKKSTALIQPSFSEGFGLTGIEAMAIGLPVLSSDIPVFHEVYGDASGYFDPMSSESLVHAINRLDTSDRSAIISKSLTQASKYSWDACADKILSLYTSVL
jgi:glycosyltransferase involved in cell wall biosynthesis